MRVWITCILILVDYLAHAQAEPSYIRYTPDQGLPSSEIFCTLQDSKGFIWFATDMGVSRFNGYEFENFSIQDGLTDNTILNLFEDHRGRIWFLPISGRLCYFQHNRIYTYAYNQKISENVSRGNLYVNVHVDQNDNVYLTGNRPPLIITKTGKVSYSTHPQEAAAFLPKSKTWVFHHIAIFPKNNPKKFRPLNMSFERSGKVFQQINVNNTQSMGASTFRATEDKNFLYIASGNVVTKLPVNGGQPEQYQTQRSILFISLDKKGGLWLVLSQGGVLYFSKSNFSQTPKHYFKNEAISSVFQDKNERYWITSEKGVLLVASLNYQSLDVSCGLSCNNVTALCGERGRIFAGNYEGKIDCITRSKIKTYPVHNSNSLYRASIYDLLLDKERMWFSGRSTSGFIDRNGKITPLKLLNFCRSIDIGQNEMAMGNFGQLFLVKRDSITPIKAPNRITSVKSLGNNWVIGTVSGVWLYRPDIDKWENLSTISEMLNNSITDIVQLNDKLFFGTKGFGLCVTDLNFRNPRPINTSNGLTSNNIKHLYPTGNELWIATDKGINRLCYVNKTAFTLESRNTEDGLVSNCVNAILKTGDSIWVATDKGITIINDFDQQKKQHIPFFITKVEVAGQIPSFSRLKKLSYRENNITIHFLGLATGGSNNVVYRYRIKGVDKHWNYTPLRSVQYANLSPGNYQFEAGVWNPNNKSPLITRLNFNINEPVWKRWWFILVSLILVTGAIILIVKVRIKNATQRENERHMASQKIVELEQKALRAQMNPHFVFNCLNSIQRFILNNDADEAYSYMVKFSRLIRCVLENSLQEFVELRHELEYVQLYLALEKLRFKTDFTYRFIIEPNLDQDILVPPMLIQPYVENAIWHGFRMSKKDNHCITVEVKQQDETILISIEDNGIGRAAASKSSVHEKHHRSYGMKITQDRIHALNKKHALNLSVTVIDLFNHENPSGTRIELTLPNHVNLTKTIKTYVPQSINN